MHADHFVGRFVAAPSFVIEIDDVFEAECSRASYVIQRAEDFRFDYQVFRHSFNDYECVRQRVQLGRGLIREDGALSSALRRSLSTSRCRLLSTAFMPRARNSSETSRMTTSNLRVRRLEQCHCP